LCENRAASNISAAPNNRWIKFTIPRNFLEIGTLCEGIQKSQQSQAQAIEPRRTIVDGFTTEVVMTRSGRRVLVAAVLICGVLVVSSLRTDAQPRNTYTQWGSVRELEAGWVEDVITVYHSAPLVNPGGCPVTNAGYATNPNDAGHSLFHTLLLNALLNSRGVALLISGCVYGKPHIIAVKIH